MTRVAESDSVSSCAKRNSERRRPQLWEMDVKSVDEQTRATDDPDYLPTLLRYWEEEIEGEAWFRALAERIDDPRRKEQLLLLAEVERRTAADVRPLLERHGLTPRPETELVAAGRAEAASGPCDWNALAAGMREAYPGYVGAFRALEAIGPAEDAALLARMTDHEVQALAFLERDHAGDPKSTEPLLRFLSTPRDEPSE